MTHMKPKALFRLAIVAVALLALPAISSTWTVDTEVHGASAMLDVSATSDAPISARADELIRRQPGLFVPNLGQWKHSARFVHRSGPMTLFLKDRGWAIDLMERRVERMAMARPHDSQQAMPEERDDRQKIRGVALEMTFEGGSRPEIVGEKMLEGHHNYLLGNDESSWRTGVPLYGAVRYEKSVPRHRPAAARDERSARVRPLAATRRRSL